MPESTKIASPIDSAVPPEIQSEKVSPVASLVKKDQTRPVSDEYTETYPETYREASPDPPTASTDYLQSETFDAQPVSRLTDSDVDNSEIIAIMSRPTPNPPPRAASQLTVGSTNAGSTVDSTSTTSRRRSWLRGEIEALQNFPKLGVPLKLRNSFKSFRNRIKRKRPGNDQDGKKSNYSTPPTSHKPVVAQEHPIDGSITEHIEDGSFEKGLSPIMSNPMSVTTSCSDLREFVMHDIDVQTNESLGNNNNNINYNNDNNTNTDDTSFNDPKSEDFTSEFPAYEYRPPEDQSLGKTLDETLNEDPYRPLDQTLDETLERTPNRSGTSVSSMDEREKLVDQVIKEHSSTSQ